MTDRPPIRIFLSPPDVGEEERRLLLEAFDSNWIAPLGPHVEAFEQELADDVGRGHAVALSSGTAGLHLALLDLGIGPGAEVITSTLTFVATANAISYVGAAPLFVDVDPETWQMDPALVVDAVEHAVSAGRPPAAVITVDLYGQCADHDPIRSICAEHGIPIIEDAAEALGASYKGRPAGALGDVGVFSFNGNKIITTGGGGMFVTDDAEQARRVRHLATQARDPAPHYEHSRIGFNYRLSNLLAAIGRAQLASLDDKIERRGELRHGYEAALGDLPGVGFLREPTDGTANHWLTCLVVDPETAGTDAETIRLELTTHGIEARPVWKPMHLQPVFQGVQCFGGDVAASIFATGVCLPSGSALTRAEHAEIIERTLGVLNRGIRRPGLSAKG